MFFPWRRSESSEKQASLSNGGPSRSPAQAIGPERRAARAHGGLRIGPFKHCVSAAIATAALLAGLAVPVAAGGDPEPTVAEGEIAALDEELPELRTEKSRTYETEDGRRVARLWTGPVNFQDAGGKWRAIDNTLRPAVGGGYENAANGYRAHLPDSADQPVRFGAKGEWVSFALKEARGPGSALQDTARYPDARPATTLSYTATNAGLREKLTLESAAAPGTFRYALRTSAGLSAQENAAGGIDFRNRSGRLAFAFAPPLMYDSSDSSDGISRAVSLRLEQSLAGQELVLTADPQWLFSPERRYPVTIDPDIMYIESGVDDTTLRFRGANQDCYITSGPSADTKLCASASHTRLKVGRDSAGNTSRSLLRFDVQNTLPRNIHLIDAKLRLRLATRTGTASTPIAVHRATRSWSADATWNRFNATTAWTNPGGDFLTPAADTTDVGASGQYFWSPLRASVQRWVDGTIANQGLLVKAADESQGDLFEFESSLDSNANPPYLDVLYEPASGARPYYTFETQQLNDRMSLSVNVASGNLLVRAPDIQIAGTGLDLSVERFFNSGLQRNAELGTGWTMDGGRQVRLRYGLNGEAILYGPSGYVVTFTKNPDNTFNTPPGFNATLTKDTTSNTAKLAFHRTGITLNFNNPAGATEGAIKSVVDQNGNTISYAYDTTTGPAAGRLTEITDTRGRKVEFVYDSGHPQRIEYVHDVAGNRYYDYDYEPASGNDLTSYTDPTDPTGKVTHYEYEPNTHELEAITDPKGNVTEINYVPGAIPKKIASIERLAPGQAEGTGDKWTFSYQSPGTDCNSADPNFGMTVLTDPEDHTTKYCYDADGRVLKVIDGNGRPQSVSYTPNKNDIATYTSPSYATLGVNASFTYNSDDSLTDIVSPTGTGANMTSKLSYAGASPCRPGGDYYKYYPESFTNAQGRKTSFCYDDQGNVTSVSDQAAGAISIERLRPDHQVTKVTDGNGSQTTYTYYPNGELKTITPPAPLGATTITYDALSRVSTVKDGKLQTRTYAYDNLDRVKKITFDDTSSTSYAYDANGNVDFREDRDSPTDTPDTTDYDYDHLNQVTDEFFPDGGHNGYTYDDVGNLATLNDGDGSTIYTYDAGNRPKTIREPEGRCTTSPTVLCTRFTYEDLPDGRSTVKRSYPNGVDMLTTLDAAGRTQQVLSSKGASTLRRFDYDYRDPGGRETELVQKAGDFGSGITEATWEYTYDPRDRLEVADLKSGTQQLAHYDYRYDGAGNMTFANKNGSLTSYAYNRANELCWSVSADLTPTMPCGAAPAGAVSYSHDKNGNMLGNSVGLAHEYNAKDQTTKAVVPAGRSANVIEYNGPNQLERVKADGTSSKFSLLGMRRQAPAPDTTQPIYFTRDEQGNLINARRTGASDYYYLFDGLGSVVGLVDESGNLVRSYSYDPFGNVRTDRDHTGAAPEDFFRFAGGYQAEGGLYHFAMRYYKPGLGRWTQEDAIEQPEDLQSANRYSYAGNNPVNFVDTTGLFFASSWFKKGKEAYEGYKKWRKTPAGACAEFAALTLITRGLYARLGASARVVKRADPNKSCAVGALTTELGARR
jgi:RHS repeat-associated protein